MSDFKNILRGLKLKKALLLSEIDIETGSKNSLNKLYLGLGQLEHQISITKKDIVRATKNIFE